MNIIKTIDITGFKESIAIVPLRYTKSANIVTLLNKLIPINQNPVAFNNFYKRQTTKQDKFFSEDTKITSIDHSNSIVILGNKDAITRVKDFIYKYIDIPIETDQSVIEVINLDYLDCLLFAPTLQALLSSSKDQNQSTTTSSSLSLHDVLIIPEQQKAPQQVAQDGETQPRVASGGNNLIIAAKASDMKMIKKIIKEMDQPEPQVILESIIVLLDQKQVKELGFLNTRSPNDPSNPYLIKWQGSTQGANGGVILDYISTDGSVPSCSGTIDSMKGLAANILRPCVGANAARNELTSTAENGSLLVSFNDNCGNTAALLQLLEQHNIYNLIAEPFIIVKNNQQASVISEESRIVRGTTQSQSTGGPIVINQEKLDAALGLKITPRIANDGNINLTISASYNTFVDVQAFNNNTQLRRTIATNTNLKNGETLIIGGLSQSATSELVQRSPFGNIPLLGWLFKKRAMTPTNNNVYIFITATIVFNPNDASNNNKKMINRINNDELHYTEKKINGVRDKIKGNLNNMYGSNFENLRDPVTRLFFKPDPDNASQKTGEYIPLF
jgi:type II secretory pathway component GspD/PulD (secretin)